MRRERCLVPILLSRAKLIGSGSQTREGPRTFECPGTFPCVCFSVCHTHNIFLRTAGRRAPVADLAAQGRQESTKDYPGVAPRPGVGLPRPTCEMVITRSRESQYMHSSRWVRRTLSGLFGSGLSLVVSQSCLSLPKSYNSSSTLVKSSSSESATALHRSMTPRTSQRQMPH
jgi:hypothetical protein